MKDSYKCFMNSPYRSIKHSTYFDVYDELFEKYRGKNITFVEIGILGGGSLFMWREFFGPDARIIGIDFNPNAKKWEKDGFEIYIGSQSDENFWEDFKNNVGMVDILLDDGGHRFEHQIITTEMMLDNIRDNGMLVVEDTHTSYMKRFGPKKYSFVEYVKSFIDKINSRSGKFPNAKKSDKRVLSIEVFESIVAFKINRTKSNLLSKEVFNNGIDDEAKDFRNEDVYDSNPIKRRINKVVRSIKNVNKVKKFF